MNAKLETANAERRRRLEAAAKKMGVAYADVVRQVVNLRGLGFTADAVARMRGASVSAVKNACADGTLKASKVGRAWIVDMRAAIDWTPRKRGWQKGRKRS